MNNTTKFKGSAKKDNFKKYIIHHIPIFILIIISCVIVFFRVNIQIQMGPIWDTFDFLSNAMYFAGYGFGYFDLTRPPVLPFLTSLIFRLGFISEVVIYVMDGMFFVLGVIGIYLFFKLRFNSFQSFLGALLFATFSNVLIYTSLGLSDMPSVSLSIWCLYFTVLAVKRNSKFFFLALPLFILAFLTRYPAGLIIFPIIFYIFINRKYIKNYKNFIIGIFLSFLILIPVLIFFFEKFGNPIYPFITIFGFTQNSLILGSLSHINPQYNINLPVYIQGESVNSPDNPFYNTDLLYFIKELPYYIGASALAVLLISVVGILIHGLFKLKNKPFNLSSVVKRQNIPLIFLVLIFILFVLTFGNIIYVMSELIFFILVYLTYIFLKKYDFKHLDLDFFFLFWFMSFFIFHSAYIIKDNRYFITMAPAIAYFLILGFNFVLNRFKLKFKDMKLSLVISGIVIIMILFSTSICLSEMPNRLVAEKSIDDNIVAATNWLKEYDPLYKNKVIYSDYWPYFSWYLKTNVKAMPDFKDNKTYYYRLNGTKVGNVDNIFYNKELNENNVDYYFSDKTGFNLTFYKPIMKFGEITIYERI